MTKALASKKAIPSRPWFSTMRRLRASNAVTAVLELPQLGVNGEKALDDDSVLTLTRYFLTGQGSTHFHVPSLIMSRGADPGGHREHTGRGRRRSDSRSR